MLYTIMKNGAKIKTAKNLTTAKEIADKEKAEVFVNGKCVYPKTEQKPMETKPNPSQPKEAASPAAPKKAAQYRLKAKMNIREKPSISSRKLDTAAMGTVVEVYEIKNDWMKVRWRDNVAFILYKKGEFAEVL